MKQYDRKSKKWLPTEEVARKVSKRKQCKGGRDHDWMLCLPWYVSIKGSKLGLDKVEEYYKIQDEREDAEIAFDDRLEAIGVKSHVYNVSRHFGRNRYYICTVCLKRK